jgi:hypothetical protein
MFIKGAEVYETFWERKTATYDRERKKKTKKKIELKWNGIVFNVAMMIIKKNWSLYQNKLED